MSQYYINGVELQIDMEDADFQEKYQAAFEQMEVTEKGLQKTGKLSDITRSYCDMFYQLFDNIFGAGTGNKLFGGRHNSKECDEVYTKFISICKEQTEAANKRRMQMTGKYLPKKKKPNYNNRSNAQHN